MAKISSFEAARKEQKKDQAAFVRKLKQLTKIQRKTILVSAGIFSAEGKLTAHYR